ncbi:hypothetical protein [Corynebacterium striatum]|uniref:hypothetical protein n=1 Tax=Corynebacterium striatum TaxID=43770 RepID=UPI00209C02C0|nr:hypothetical protein [Corynebacterium striatum]
MNKFSRVCARALTVGLLSLGVVSGGGVGATAPEAAALTPEEQHQFLVDPVGAVLWQGIKGSSDALNSNRGAAMAASFYSMNSPAPGIGLPAFDRCVQGVGSSTTVPGVRYVVAGLCAMLDPAARSEIERINFSPQY